MITTGVANKIGASSALNQVSDKAWGRELTTNLATAGSSATISTAINGGILKDNLGNAALGALVNTVHGEIVSKIKVGLSEDYITHKITHAVAGCGAAATNKGKCLDGAIEAAAGEMVAEAYGKPDINLPDAEYQRQTDKLLAVTKIVSGSVSSLLGGNFEKTADVAENTVMNNFLYPEQDADIKKQLANCAGQHAGSSSSLLACQGGVIKIAHTISEQNDRLLAAAYEAAKKGNSTKLNRLNQSFTRATDAKGIAQLKSILKSQYPKASEARITELAGQSITQFQQDWHLARSRVAAVAPTEFVNKATA